jgi:hypothetical protein
MRHIIVAASMLVVALVVTFGAASVHMMSTQLGL